MFSSGHDENPTIRSVWKYVETVYIIHITLYLHIPVQHTSTRTRRGWSCLRVILGNKTTTVFKGEGHTQNVNYMFQGVFEGGLEDVSLHICWVLDFAT